MICGGEIAHVTDSCGRPLERKGKGIQQDDIGKLDG